MLRGFSRYFLSYATRARPAFHRLHSLLVHEGQAGGGHYWAFVRDEPTNQWYRLSDTIVTKVFTVPNLSSARSLAMGGTSNSLITAIGWNIW